MTIRITSGMIAAQTIRFAKHHQSSLGQIQERLISGRKVNRPSDDPLAYRSLLTNLSVDQRFEVQKENIRVARDRLNMSVTELLAAKDLIVRAKEIALGGGESPEPNVLAQEVESLHESLLHIANQQVDDVFLFSGTGSSTKPFVTETVNGKDRIVYVGSSERSQVTVGVSINVDVLYSGGDVFETNARGTTQYLGVTGAAAGIGTDSATGRGQLEVRHVATSFAGGSGVAAGVSSAMQDTIVGPAGAHTLYIDDTSGSGAAGTVSLNGGPAVSFIASDADLVVTGLDGEKVHLDMRSITAGFQGTVDITASATLSLDGGITELSVDFSDNQQFVDPETGAVTNVDTRDVRQAGMDHVEYEGTSDAFEMLHDLRDDLLRARGLSNEEFHNSMGRRIGDLDRMIDHLLEVIGEQAGDLDNLDAIQVRHEDVQLETRRVISEIQSTDIAEAILQLQQQQNLLDVTYASSARLMDQSLLNFLR